MSEHYISIDPAIMSGSPCINHSRIPVTVLANFYLAGDSIDFIAELYSIHRHDVLVACWYLGIYGRLKRWIAWRKWAESVGAYMWAGEWEQVPDPPREKLEASK